MTSVKVRLHKIKVDNERFIQDNKGIINLDIHEGSTVKTLFDMFGIEPAGKVVLIDGESCSNFDNIINHCERIEIFQMFAGG